MLLPDAQDCEEETIDMCVYEAGRTLGGLLEAQGGKETAERRQQVEGKLEKDRGLSFKGLSEAHISYGDEDGRRAELGVGGWGVLVNKELTKLDQ